MTAFYSPNSTFDDLLSRLETGRARETEYAAGRALDVLRELTQAQAGAILIELSSEHLPIVCAYSNSSETQFSVNKLFYSNFAADENVQESSWQGEGISLHCKILQGEATFSQELLKLFLAHLSGIILQQELTKRLQQSTNEVYRLRLNLENSFHSIPDAIVTIAEDKRIISANEAFLTLFGGDFSDYKGKTLKECFNEASTPYENVIKQTLELGRITSHFRITSNIFGKECKLELNAAPLRTGEFSFGGAVLVIKDMTRLAVLEQQLEDRKLLNNMVGKSESMQQVASLINSLSDIGTTVLVTGESGTGKELVADALHYTGVRSDKKIVKVNCAALSESLLESELFGHVRGAFTGATGDSKGRVAAAEGGTLFLDEIGDLPLSIQLKLLRFLESKQYERVGNATPLYADVRVVTATNADLLQKVEEGTFRKDLYYRLNVFQIELPPLRKRKEDIPLLVRNFVTIFNNELGRSIKSISPEVMDIFVAYHWPGNIRELRHSIEHAAILCTDEVLQPYHLPKCFREAPRKEIAQAHPCENTNPYVAATVPQVETGAAEYIQGTYDVQRIIEALELANGKKAQAARILGVSRPTLYRWMKRAGLSE